MEILALGKILNIVITIILVLVVYFIQRYFFKQQTEDYEQFTSEVKAESKEREQELMKVIGKNQDVIINLSNKLDVVEDIRKDVNSIKEMACKNNDL